MPMLLSGSPWSLESRFLANSRVRLTLSLSHTLGGKFLQVFRVTWKIGPTSASFPWVLWLISGCLPHKYASIPRWGFGKVTGTWVLGS